jgi:hypothetical protein
MDIALHGSQGQERLSMRLTGLLEYCPSSIRASLHSGIRLDTLNRMITFHRSDEFDTWLAALKDKIGRARIALRIRSAEHGNFGDCEPVGGGVSEMRIHFGPGYRV